MVMPHKNSSSDQPINQHFFRILALADTCAHKGNLLLLLFFMLSGILFCNSKTSVL